MTDKRLEIISGPQYRVLALDGVDDAGIKVLDGVAEVEVRKTIPQDHLHKIIPNFDAIIVRSATTVTEALIRQGTRLKVIGRAGVGVDNICLEAATTRGIYVVNSPQGNTIAAAELTLSFMLALSRKIALADASVSRGEWERSRFQGSQVHGKTIGIVGLGQVGSYIARICVAMEMVVLIYDPFVNQAKAKALGASMVSLEELLANSDIVTLHVPLMETTKKLIRKETLALMKPTAILINTSRGGVVDEAAVAAALSCGQLGGAALDVFVEEKPFSPTNPLLVAKNKGINLILTPHIGASTREAQVNVSLDVAQQVKQILQGDLPKSAVNLPSVRLADMPKTARHLRHAETLGRLSAQLLQQPIEKLHLEVSGDLLDEHLDVLLLAVAQGVLATHCEHRVNFVNVRQIAAEHKLHLSVSKAYGTRRTLYLEVSVHSITEIASIGGCLTTEGTLILRKFKGTPIAFCLPPINPVSPLGSPRSLLSPVSSSPTLPATEPNGKAAEPPTEEETDPSRGEGIETQGDRRFAPIYMFYTLHLDRPGVLAGILSLVSSAGINVANCHLGRRLKEKETPERESPSEVLGLCIFHTDSEVQETLLQSIRALPFVREAFVFATPRTLGQTRSL